MIADPVSGDVAREDEAPTQSVAAIKPTAAGTMEIPRRLRDRRTHCMSNMKRTL
jgi:hypothetical protein